MCIVKTLEALTLTYYKKTERLNRLDGKPKIKTMKNETKELTKKEIKTFTTKCNELLDWVKLYGLPSAESCFVMEIMMSARLRSIKQRPELLNIAKRIDKGGVLFN